MACTRMLATEIEKRDNMREIMKDESKERGNCLNIWREKEPKLT